MFGCVVRPDSKLPRFLSISNRSSFYVLNAKLRTSKRKKDSLQKRVICWKDWEGKAQVSRHRLGYQGREEEVENRNRNRNWGCLLIKKQLNQTFYMRRELLVLLTACQVRCGKIFFTVSILRRFLQVLVDVDSIFDRIQFCLRKWRLAS